MAKSVKLEICWRCHGTGEYRWGPMINGKPPLYGGACFKCVGGGEFPRTSGAAWYTQHGRAILASIETMAHAGNPGVEPDAEDDLPLCQECEQPLACPKNARGHRRKHHGALSGHVTKWTCGSNRA